MDDITRYEKQLYEQEKHFKSDKDRAQDRVDKSNYYGNEVRRKEIELAKQRGEQIAALKKRKDVLEDDRR